LGGSTYIYFKFTAMKTPDKLLAKKFMGTASNDELEQLQQWLSEQDENQSVLDQARQMWNELGFGSSEFSQDRQVAWEMMVNTIKPVGASERRSLSKLITQTVVVIAALFAVTGVVSTLLTYNANTEVTATQRSQRVDLPDGTTVYLDSATSVKYPKSFGKRNRTVTLVGEAIFEASPSQKLPLTIRTKMGLVVVDGIADVATDGKATLDAMALRGGLKLTMPGKSIDVTEGNGVSVDPSGNPAIVPININLIAWRTNQIVAKNTSLGSLIKPIEKLTGKRVMFQSTVDYSQRLSFTVKPATERAVADTLASRLRMSVRITSQSIVFY